MNALRLTKSFRSSKGFNNTHTHVISKGKAELYLPNSVHVGPISHGANLFSSFINRESVATTEKLLIGTLFPTWGSNPGPHPQKQPLRPLDQRHSQPPT